MKNIKQYKKNIFDINYNKLNKKCLIFDLDNTIGKVDQPIIDKKTLVFLNNLANDYKIVIISNNTTPRVKKFLDKSDFYFIANAKKPFSFCFKKILKDNNYNKKDVIMIGDQLFTDMLGSYLFKIDAILVDPVLKKEDYLPTKIIRNIESIYYKVNKQIKKGRYYE